MAAGNGAQRSDQIKQLGNPVTSLRYVPGGHSQNAVVIFILFLVIDLRICLGWSCAI